MNDIPCQLYLITPPAFEPKGFAPILESALDSGGVATVQLRLKDADDEAIRRAADVLRPLVQKHDISFILNDRPDLAADLGCDGVHIGQDDASYDEARSLIGPEGIIGVTCHDSRHMAMTAAEKGADYVAFGAFFPTSTKEPKTRATLEVLEIWSQTTTVPVVAIGGITPENCLPLVQAGADFLAVCSNIWGYSGGPAAAVKAFNDVITKT